VLEPSLRAGEFDALAVDIPFVFSVDERVGMTYVGWDGTGYQTALTWRRPDGSFPRGHLVLPRDPASDLLRHNAALTSILRDSDQRSAGELVRVDGWFIGTFHAYPGSGYEVGPGSIGFCRSRDLESWEVFGPTLRPGVGGPWSAGGLYKSWLVRHDGLFHLFYNAKDVETGDWIEQTGLLVSPDLQRWEAVGPEPVLPVGGPGSFDERFASDPCVLHDGEQWVMHYFGLATDGHARVGVATSSDLRTWRKAGVLIDVGASGDADAVHAHKTVVIAEGGALRHYYCAVGRRGPIEVGGVTTTEARGIATALQRVA
jgi:predicted GH43/DUF377 family glycosyl hydrolase